MRIPVAKEGYFLILFFLFLTFVATLIASLPIGGIFFLLTIFVLFFFRDPEREIPIEKSAIISPADGRIIQIREVEAGAWALDVPAIQLSIFMSVFNVHVNRVPFGGKILEKNYNPGKFLPAYREKASKLNEQTTILIKTPKGFIRVTQIAGLIARRVVCWPNAGDTLLKGQRFGLIKFGSRVDLFLPKAVVYMRRCNIGTKVKAGESVLAHFL
ncbi:MAG: phosphatidylserine decarboxylase family protein [bacterium]